MHLKKKEGVTTLGFDASPPLDAQKTASEISCACLLVHTVPTMTYSHDAFRAHIWFAEHVWAKCGLF